MSESKKTPETVTVDREALFDLVAAFTAADDLFNVLAGGAGEHPVSELFDSQLTNAESWVGACGHDAEDGTEIEVDDFFGDPVRVEIKKAAAAFTTAMLRKIIADPYSQLVPRNMTRPRLHDFQLSREAAARGMGEGWEKFFLSRGERVAA